MQLQMELVRRCSAGVIIFVRLGDKHARAHIVVEGDLQLIMDVLAHVVPVVRVPKEKWENERLQHDVARVQGNAHALQLVVKSAVRRHVVRREGGHVKVLVLVVDGGFQLLRQADDRRTTGVDPNNSVARPLQLGAKHVISTQAGE